MKRTLQLLTGVHRIHHLYYSYGWKLPLIQVGWFKLYGIRRLQGQVVLDKDLKPMKRHYHDCTLTGVY